jgi:hypothetical protein
MSYNVTFDPSGESVVESRGGRNMGHVGVTAGGRDDFTGEYQEPQFDRDFTSEGIDALPPQYRHEYAHTPITDSTSSTEQVVAWLKQPGEVTQDQINTLVEAWDRNGTPGHERDTLMQLISYKAGEVPFGALSEDALEMLGIDPTEAAIDDPVNGALEELQDSLDPEIQQQLERLDDASYEDLQVLTASALECEADYSVVNEQREQAQELYNNGDYAGAFISELSAQFHEGEITQEQAIKIAIEKVGLQDSIDAFSKLSLGYSAVKGQLRFGNY